MGLGVQGATANVSSSNRNVNAETGPLATNTLKGMSENLADGVDSAAVPLHFQQQVAEAQAAAVGAAGTVANPLAAKVGGMGAPALVAPQTAASEQAATLPAVSSGAPVPAAFCANCGAQLVSGAQFCAACGKPCAAASQPAADMV